MYTYTRFIRYTCTIQWNPIQQLYHEFYFYKVIPQFLLKPSEGDKSTVSYSGILLKDILKFLPYYLCKYGGPLEYNIHH